MVKRILLPTDFSENAWKAIHYALRLFQDEECHFILLNTYTPITYSWEAIDAGAIPIEILEEMRILSEDGLQVTGKRIQEEYQNPKHTFSEKSTINPLPLEIQDLFDLDAIDWVVMGTQGATGVKRVLFGSNTVRVLDTAQCPVMAIPSVFSFDTLQEILFPSDFKINFNHEQLQPLLELAKRHGATLNILHVMEKGGLSQEQQKNKEVLEGLLKGIPNRFHEMPYQTLPEAVTEFERGLKVDLLVLFNNKHSFITNLFFSSTLHRIGFHLTTPLLVMPKEA